ncbi:MAG: hypothetical protein JRN35_06160 [Nitrososphaerota archaeon]|nr:hypothetical protein [Nitrososphaerota archaeon]
MTTVQVHYGALAEPLAKQLAEFIIEDDDLEHFQKDVDAIVRLKIRGILSDGVASSAFRRLQAHIVKAIKGVR